MSVEAIIHRLVCDDCRAAWISPVGRTDRVARDAAQLAGWTTDTQRDTDRCPRCTRKAHDSALVGGVES